ncbi:RIB43A-like with coiled-coils protein 2 [Tachyglossus aculeatus]|uniref:RIB43A-like with coiled-coils protein 2 n=1 Tax=Tachyglossus aculeatus TaxID=9261 RepID=UPI0018F4D01B|nr:RIB43A-like with coiled-coils protein 2 [Tachyglossus aculeatus]
MPQGALPKVVLPRDLKEEAALKRRRHAELLRQCRVFNARNRLIGCDLEAWNAQVHDRKIQEATEKARNEAIAAEMRWNDKTACLLDQRQRRDRRRMEEALVGFHRDFQGPETRRELDLSDPQARKREAVLGPPDQDPRWAISGMQTFQGEDVNFEVRKKFQEEQMREWSLQQQRAQKNALADQKSAEDLYARTVLDLDQKAMDMQRLEAETRRAVCAATKEFNKAQAEELAEKRWREKQQEQRENAAEISHLLEGSLLSEHRGLQGARGVGMSQDQLDDIRAKQQQQVREKLRFREDERQSNADWDQQRIQEDRAAILFERQQQRLHRELRRDLDNHNLHLAQQQKSRKKLLEEETYTNCPTEKYFEQFNTTSR